MITVTNILGVERQAEVNAEDGSYICPFCGYPVFADAVVRDGRRCQNPVCSASVMATVENAEHQQREYEERRQRQVEREWAIAAMDAYSARSKREQAEERAAARAEAVEHGWCGFCIVADRPKRVRHRAPENCPVYQRHHRRSA